MHIKTLLILLASLFIGMACTQKPTSKNEKILLNSLGYLPSRAKKATLLTQSPSFKIRDAASKKVVYRDKAKGPITQADVNQTAYVADFSNFNQSGTFILETKNGTQSTPFRIDSAYVHTCLDAAILSYNFLSQHPEYKKWEQKEFQTGGYQTPDVHARITAAAQLWETTGDKKYLADFENRIRQTTPLVDLNWDWQYDKNLGVFCYLLSEREGKTKPLEDSLKTALIQMADSIVYYTQTDIYGRPFEMYYWGCNGTLARLSANLSVAYELTKEPKYKVASQDIVAHLFGRNVYGRTFVTGLGINPPMHPHDRRSAADSIVAPWPGYLVGGGHTATDWVDEEADYSRNEIAINWQAALVYALTFAMN